MYRRNFVLVAAIAVFVNETNCFWLRSPRVLNRGNWNPESRCPEGSYVYEIEVKIDSDKLPYLKRRVFSGVQLGCVNVTYPAINTTFPYPIVGHIDSFNETYGTWQPSSNCDKGLAVGYRVLVDQKTGTNDMKLLCANSRGLVDTTQENGLKNGNWSDALLCPPLTALSGIQVQTETYSESKKRRNYTTIGNIDLLCTDLPNPAQLCKPSDDWVAVFSRDHSEGRTPTSISIHQKLGVSYESTEHTNSSILSEVSVAVGLSGSLSASIFTLLGINFEFKYHKKTEYNWSRYDTLTWSNETEINQEFTILPACDVTIYQLQGRCGPYSIMASPMKRVDICKVSNVAEQSTTVPILEILCGIGLLVGLAA